jgi:hypothetical protein
VKPYTLCTTLLLLACGGDNAGPSGITAAQITGTWDMNATGCLSGNLPVRLSASSDGALTSAVNAWTNSEPAGFFRPLDGTVALATGAAEFHMWSDASHDAAMLFVGTLSADGSLTGTVADPMTGHAPVFHFSGGPDCTATATGHRR